MTEHIAIPLITHNDSVEILKKFKKHPSIVGCENQSWWLQPFRELDATNDKKYMDTISQDCPRGFWPIYKGTSFNIWEPDNGLDSYYAWGNPAILLNHLQEKRL